MHKAQSTQFPSFGRSLNYQLTTPRFSLPTLFLSLSLSSLFYFVDLQMAENDLSRRRYFGGIFALLGVVFIWVTSSFAMNVSVRHPCSLSPTNLFLSPPCQSIFGELEYNKPFLITYLNTATFSFYLIPSLFRRSRKQIKDAK